MDNTNKVVSKINCTAEELYDLFIVQNKSYNDIAKIFDCSKDCVKAALRKHHIRKVDDSGNRIERSTFSLPPVEEVSSITTNILESGESGEIIITKTPKEEFKEILTNEKGDVKKALFNYCFKHNIFFDDVLVQSMIDKHSDSLIFDLPDYYIIIINQTPKYKDLNFLSQLKMENFSKIYSEDLNLLALSEDDKKNRQQVMTILGYDPFKEDSDDERPQLYRDLTGLVTDNLRKDIAKQKAAVEIVRNYATISRYQKRLSILMKTGKVDEDTRSEMDELLKMIGKIQLIINATTKENGFTAGKTVGNNGRGMLSDVMNQVEEQGYDVGITNFYDQATSKSIEEIANISNKALLNQVRLTGTDYTDILQQQNTIVREAQIEARKAMEACRIAKEKITKQELLKELEEEYRRKNISEDEIREFINREYRFYDPGDKK